MLITLILDAIKPSCERIDIIQVIIGSIFVIKHSGSRSCDLANLRKWCDCHDPFQAGMLIYLSFQTVQCWQLFLCNSSNKRRRTYIC